MGHIKQHLAAHANTKHWQNQAEEVSGQISFGELCRLLMVNCWSLRSDATLILAKSKQLENINPLG